MQWAFANSLIVILKADPKTIGLTIFILRQSGKTISYDNQQSLFLTLFKIKKEPKIKLISMLREGAFSGGKSRLGQSFKIWYDDTFCFFPKVFAL